MEKLISMTDFVSVVSHKTDVSNIEENFAKIFNYAEFLKQPLTLGMFIPCDEKGDVIKWMPYFDYKRNRVTVQDSLQKYDEYQKAKEKVLFKGFYYNFNEETIVYKFRDDSKWIFDIYDIEKQTVESFGGIDNEIELTELAKQKFN